MFRSGAPGSGDHGRAGEQRDRDDGEGELVNIVPALMICPACGAEGRRVIFRRAANATPTCSRCGSTLRRATQRDFEAHAAKTWGTAA